MGCTCDNTKCSICGKIASNKNEFCRHLKSGNKGKWFEVNGSKRQAYEDCLGVCFAELSAVDQPADPRAVSAGETFSLQAQLKQREDLLSILAFSKVNSDTLPPVVAELIADYLEGQILDV